ncbi:hypothetical protein DSO57_1023049 [Entomophthora muscae]|uniref:Uncharacterized protein n=1 Tax=Entomophthora muscae TaxID=34485 RepID=A0ACC2RHQ7_9FUNG|nr:hypothetical protein DSO57_1023049 [Entomophthora muscae]
MQSQTPEHVQPYTIGNTSIHIVQRAAALLKLFTTLPSNPRHFRPAPHSQSPFDFKNPYTSATALTYDFIQTVQQNPIEYSNNPGFRTHIIKQHLQKRHFKADLLPEARTKHFTYTCPPDHTL